METCKNISEFLEVIRRVEALTDEFIDISISTDELVILKTDTYRGIVVGEEDINGRKIYSGRENGGTDLSVVARLFEDIESYESGYVFKVYIDKHVCSDGSGEWFSIDFVYTEK